MLGGLGYGALAAQRSRAEAEVEANARATLRAVFGAPITVAELPERAVADAEPIELASYHPLVVPGEEPDYLTYLKNHDRIPSDANLVLVLRTSLRPTRLAIRQDPGRVTATVHGEGCVNPVVAPGRQTPDRRVICAAPTILVPVDLPEPLGDRTLVDGANGASVPLTR